jgi:hypothetical protein
LAATCRLEPNVQAHLGASSRSSNSLRVVSLQPCSRAQRRAAIASEATSPPVLVDGRTGERELLRDLIATKASGGDLLDLVRPLSAVWPVEHFGRYPPRRAGGAFRFEVSDGTRTRDRLDHNQELYRLSYAHRGAPVGR